MCWTTCETGYLSPTLPRTHWNTCPFWKNTAEAGYYIAEEFWGLGIGTSALRQLRRYIFSHTDIIRLFAMPFDDNAASCRILENCGFSLEGILRCNAVKNGTVRDMRMYAALSSV